MNKYIFSIFVRSVITLSGFFIFFVSLKIFGFSGRGIIAYGMSIFSMFGILLSFNMGRAFLKIAQDGQPFLIKSLNQVLLINIGLMLIGLVASLLFWFITDSTKNNIPFKTFLILSLIMPYCLWTINGSAIFASLERTLLQDKLILLVRVIVILFSLAFLYLKIDSLDLFLFLYAMILSLSAIIEMLFLYDFKLNFLEIFKINDFYKLLVNSIPGHFDFIAFNIYPVLLIIISGIYLDVNKIGEVNYVIQMINFVFIFGYVASLKVNSYTAVVGFNKKITEIKWLFGFTIVVSIFSILLIVSFINYGILDFIYPDLYSLNKLFLLGGFAIFGYIAYQFSYPIILEFGFIKMFSKLNWINVIVLVILSFIVIPKYGMHGVIMLFVGFHFGLFLTSLYVLMCVFKRK